LFGFLLAYSAIRGGLPRFVRINTDLLQCGFKLCRVPLALCFHRSAESSRLLITWMRMLGYNPYFHGFTLYTFGD
jgi:hypothetical protein